MTIDNDALICSARAAGADALEQGQFAEAARAYAFIVGRARDDAAAAHGLALAFRGIGDAFAALGAARRATELAPESADRHATLGLLLLEMGDHRGAVAALERARVLEPGAAAIAIDLSTAYRAASRVPEAQTAARAACALDSAPEAYVALGRALHAGGDEIAAYEMFLHARDLDPSQPIAECGLGAIHLTRAEWNLARDAFRRALTIAPQCAFARYNAALLELRFGHYAEGYAGYPAIMDTLENGPRYYYARRGVPVWDGAPLDGRRLVIAAEQGLGDHLMMARFFPRLARVGDSITIEAPPAVFALFQRVFPAFRFRCFTHWAELDTLDTHLPIAQLPRLFGIACDDDLATPGPYLNADPTRVAAMRASFDGGRAVSHVGIVWHGNALNSRERWRAAPLPHWAPLGEVSGVRFHSLQAGARDEELASAPFPLAATHRLIGDMEDTAALMTLCDTVISVDTSTVHLAGALGVRTWMPNSLVSDYRWGIDRSDSPWYPSLRIFRQRERDGWHDVFADIAQELRALLQTRLPA